MNKRTYYWLFLYSVLIMISALLLFLPSLWLDKINSKDNIVVLLLILFASLLISRTIISFFAMTVGEKIKNKIEKELRINWYSKKIKSSDQIFIENFNLLSLEILNSSRIYANALVNIVEGFWFVITSFSYGFIYIWLKHLYLFIYSFFIILVWILLSFVVRKYFAKMQKKNINAENDFSSFFTLSLNSSKIGVLLNKQDFLLKKIKEKAHKSYHEKNKLIFAKSLNNLISTAMFAVSQLGIIFLGLYLSNNNLITGSINSIVYLSGLFAVPIVRIDKFFTDFIELKNSKFYLSNLFSIQNLKVKKEKINKINKIDIIDFSFNIGNKKNLKNINFVLKKGDILKISGKSGAGKTTFLKLFLENQKKYQGQILINDVWEKANCFFDIAYVDQDTSLFPWSIEDNLFLSDKNDYEKIMQKMKLEKFIDKKDHKIDSLSGGEKKRVEIARTLVSNAELIIMDEPFVGIDHQTKNEIVAMIKNNAKDKIIIFTTHDKNLRLHNKEIVL